MQTTSTSTILGSFTNRPTGRRLVACAALFALGLGVAACGGDVTAPDDVPATEVDDEIIAGGSFTMLRSGPAPASWDPTDPSSDGMTDPGGTGVLMQAVYGVLAYEDFSTGAVVPSMVEAITSSDGITWTVAMREGMTFSDGTPFDAEAVKFNWERHLDPELLSAQAGAVAAIESMTVVDPLQLEVVLLQPNAQFDRTVARNLPFVGSPTAIESDLESFRSDPVGAGPFLLDDYVAEQEARFVKNPDYWNAPQPYLDELAIVTIADHEQRYNAFATGQGELVQLSRALSHVADAESQGYQVFINRSGGGAGLMINHRGGPFDNLVARQALTLMFDNERRTEALDFGVSSALTALFPEGSPYRNSDMQIRSYDPEAAQALLDEYAEATGGPLTFDITMYDGVRDVGELYHAQIQEFDNLEVGLDFVAANEFVPTLVQGQFDVALFPFAFGEPVESFRDYLTAAGPLNWGGYENADLDAMIAEAAATLDVEERVAIFDDVQQIVIDDVPYVFMTDNPDVQLATGRVRGLEYAIDGIPLWDGIWLAQ